MMKYAEVILPLPLQGHFTYSIPPEMAGRLSVGSRVIVSFGPRRFYTAIVAALTDRKPGDFDVKPIAIVLDDKPVVRNPQLRFWQWIAQYYLCTEGDVYKAALPAGLKIESETYIELPAEEVDYGELQLSEREAMVIQALAHAGKAKTVGALEKELHLSGLNAVATALLEKGAVMVSEKLVERYHTRKVRCVRIKAENRDTETVRGLFDTVKSPRQVAALQTLIHLTGFTQRSQPLREVTVADLRERADVSPAVIKALVDKGVFELYVREVNRFSFTGVAEHVLPTLSAAQSEALRQVHHSWFEHEVTLLHGVTSSGKTELYIHLIDYVLQQGRQVLYLVPEIALTTQLTDRLQRVFGKSVVIYHSKFSDSERVEIWRRLLGGDEPCVVIGARSSVFLPFARLGLVIVDEEHETSYKQQDPAPRYNGRDAALVLARMHGAKALLGSATPAIDTYYKATTGRYGLVTLSERYGGIALPQIRLVDVGRARLTGQLEGALASESATLVREAVESGHQAIIFLNRRGYAPVAVCKLCAYTPKCRDCDVTLTYHKRIDRLVCHYCGAVYPVVDKCPACGEMSIEVVGYGTERIEDEIEAAFPGAGILRMDLDTTRNKDGYQKIINEFSEGKAQILVGTQMVTKGLDFDRVTAVVIVNADALLNQPDFRSAERSFNMITQVAGRAGRRASEDATQQSVVAIQTRQPSNPILALAARHDYGAYYTMEVEQRRQYNYPPFTRLIYIYLKHRDPRLLDQAAADFALRLRGLFGNRVSGPEEPAVGRVQTLFIRKIMLKIETEASMSRVKAILREAYEDQCRALPDVMRSAVVYYDVDPM